MARQKLHIDELYEVSGKILVEKGYAGFHFKLVSDQLNVSRSTIYEYFSNKDELIASLMVHLMDTIMDEYKDMDEIARPLAKLRNMYDSFMKYADIHQILLFAPFVNGAASPNVEKAMTTLRQQHYILNKLLTDVIEACKEEGTIRREIPSELIAGLLFQSIQIPQSRKVAEEEWHNLIFQVMLDGYGVKM
ncbi:MULTISPECIES: TetR/AcrR family transcriptional regulator [Brevibacillus]|uniref:TetR/AcrR family transcriptional regulator n=1 Tax=Brevibacillus TaxID=55080 RepID=UPI002472F0E3|nr:MULTISPECIES: TetR/AcrR family transcriptional regulator [Brevibacillus]MDH6351661.1 AcrR family transcriptional regulator [Brevibacillus sp. 1238]MDR4997530.1 TetR/AcrR family transcriptional regulator [Brevibacillus parabrevis]